MGLTLCWGLIGTIAILDNVKAPQYKPVEGSELPMIEGNSLVAPRIPVVIKGTTMAFLEVFDEKTISDTTWTTDELKMVVSQIGENKDLIECLIKKESMWNAYAVGDSGNAFGLLQFWRSTFDFYKEKYGEEWLEYENPLHQIILADLMLKDNLWFHWTTYNKCK